MSLPGRPEPAPVRAPPQQSFAELVSESGLITPRVGGSTVERSATSPGSPGLHEELSRQDEDAEEHVQLPEDRSFTDLHQEAASLISDWVSAVSAFGRLVTQLGTQKDTQEMRAALHVLQHSSREMMNEVRMCWGALRSHPDSQLASNRLHLERLRRTMEDTVARYFALQNEAQARQKAFFEAARRQALAAGGATADRGEWSEQESWHAASGAEPLIRSADRATVSAVGAAAGGGAGWVGSDPVQSVTRYGVASGPGTAPSLSASAAVPLRNTATRFENESPIRLPRVPPPPADDVARRSGARDAQQSGVDSGPDAAERQWLLSTEERRSDGGLQLVQADLDVDQQILEERESSMREIEAAVLDINAMYRELGMHVELQGRLVDTVEENIVEAARNAEHATQDIEQAAKLQRSSRTRICCLLLVAAVVAAALAVVLVLALRH